MINLISNDFYITETLKDFLKSYRKKSIFPSCKESLMTSLITDPNSKRSRFLPYKSMDKSIRALSDFFEKNNNSIDIQDVSEYSIQTGAELFLQMTLCPPSSVIDKWKLFLEFLFSEYLSPQQKVLSLVKIINDKKSKDGQEIANAIMARLSRVLGFQYLIPEISNQRLSSSVKWGENVESIQGKTESIYNLDKN